MLEVLLKTTGIIAGFEDEDTVELGKGVALEV